MRGRIVKQARAFDVRIGARHAIMGQTENGPGGAGNTVTAKTTGQPGNQNSAGIHSRPGKPGRNARSVWHIATQPFPEAHFATMPRSLAEKCVQAGCKPGGTVLDPFSGSGTTGLAAAKHGRRYVGIDLSRDYLDLSLRTRLGQTALLDGGVA